jgi:hypothetical protein
MAGQAISNGTANRDAGGIGREGLPVVSASSECVRPSSMRATLARLAIFLTQALQGRLVTLHGLDADSCFEVFWGS